VLTQKVSVSQELEAQIAEYSGKRGKAQDLFYLNLYAGLLAEVSLSAS